MSRLREFVKSLLAGMMISIGGTVYLSCDNKYVGALFFCTGLIAVVMLGFNLYTGKVGYILQNGKAFFADTLLSVVGNCAACLACGLVRAPVGSVVQMCEAKLSKGLWTVFADAVFCGILIFVCVDIWKKYKRLIGVLVCVPTFILSGFEHSVADMFYFANARIFTAQSALFILIVLLGNAVGGLLIPVLMSFADKKDEKQAP